MFCGVCCVVGGVFCAGVCMLFCVVLWKSFIVLVFMVFTKVAISIERLLCGLLFRWLVWWVCGCVVSLLRGYVYC